MPKGVYKRTPDMMTGKHPNSAFPKGHKINTGRKHTRKWKRNQSILLKGKYTEEKGSQWKGDKVKYGGLHDWVRKWKGTPDKCEGCGKSGLKGRKINWANIDHKYSRVLEDYIRLCKKCHYHYDRSLKLL